MNHNIVWIDDDYDIIAPLIRPLQRAGNSILRLRTVAETLAQVEAVRGCDLVILDILLPTGGATIDQADHYTGRTLLRLLKTEYDFQRPVIVCSVVSQADVLADLEALGVRAILNKTETTASRLKQVAEEIFASP